MLEKSTENTTMELDGKGPANFEQLQELIHKECDKHDWCYMHLKTNTTNLNMSSKTMPQKTFIRGGCVPTSTRDGALKKKKSTCNTPTMQQ